MNRTMIRFSLVVLFLAIAGSGLFAADAFLPRLERALVRLGFQERETAMIMAAAREWNWESAEPGFADMAALSISVCERVRSETQAREQVELVYNLAALNREMEALGFTKREIARIALNASRDVEARFRERDAAGGAAGRGDMIRDRIRVQLCGEGLASQELRIMERIRARAQLNRAPERGHGSPH